LRLFGAIAILCSRVPGWAQMSEVPTLRVELKCENCGVRPEYSLELYEVRTRQKVASADLEGDGGFTLRHVPYGDYQMSILDAGGNALYDQHVNIAGMIPAMVIHLAAPVAQRPPGGPVSLAQLQHPPTRKAFQAARAAQKFSESGNYEKAAEELQKAIRISPYYTDAYTNLAVQHIRLGRYEEAAGELARALEIGGPHPLVLTNLAATQLALKRFAESAQSARSALRLEPDYMQAHFILGMALSTDTRTVQEGLEHLRKAAETIPNAQVQIEKVQRAMVRR